MQNYAKIADKQTVDKTIESLKTNGIEAQFVETGEEAKKKVFEILPQGAEVMNMTSVTLDTIGVAKEIMESGRYNSVRPQ